MSSPENNEKIDEDILQCKKDILRAKDIIPGAAKKAAASKEGAKKPDSRTKKAPISAKKNETNSKSVKSSGQEPEKAAIPRFDLAEKILAEQRKAVAARRQSPVKKPQQEKKESRRPIKYAIEQLSRKNMQSDGIIAEIVAQDIERLLKGKN